MEAEYYAARANLRRLMRLHPRWTQPQYAQAVGMSLSWVKKWKKRLEEAGPEDEQVLHSRSRARKHPPERISPTVTDRILQMRDEPPEGLQRTPGPKAILYYLPRDEQLQGKRLPRSSRTIYRILQQAGRIAHRLPHLQEPLERPAPMSHWQLDFKDASTVPADPDGKRQHMVEVLNTVDEGTSVLVEAQVGADFRAETTVGAVAQLFVRHGLPEAVRMDRDVRFVSSPSGSDFPSALVRFCQCLGVGVLLCDPRHPQQNGFVERYHRTFQEECLAVQRPLTLEQVREVTAQFEQHYNYERPHQGLSCGNRPPRVAFPTLPAPVDRPSYERAVATARVQLGEQAFVGAWQEGRTMPLEQILAAQGPVTMPEQAPTGPSSAPHAPKASPSPDGLTAREVEVLHLLAQGLTSAQIAERLVISVVTVNFHVR